MRTTRRGFRHAGAALIVAAAIAPPQTSNAGAPEVLHVVVEPEGIENGVRLYTVSATLRHDDEGWHHYADGFEVLSPDALLMGVRVLHHPHVEEQPFTRSLWRVAAPPGIDRIIVRAHDSVHGYGDVRVEATLPAQ